MNIAHFIYELTTHPQTATSPKHSWGLPYWVLFTGILSGACALALVSAAVTP
jgi:hypothetical protein